MFLEQFELQRCLFTDIDREIALEHVSSTRDLAMQVLKHEILSNTAFSTSQYNDILYMPAEITNIHTRCK